MTVGVWRRMSPLQKSDCPRVLRIRHPMSGPDLGSAPTSAPTADASSGVRTIGPPRRYRTTKPQRNSGTDIACWTSKSYQPVKNALLVGRELGDRVRVVICLVVRYAVSGTELVHGGVAADWGPAQFREAGSIPTDVLRMHYAAPATDEGLLLLGSGSDRQPRRLQTHAHQVPIRTTLPVPLLPPLT